MDNEMHAYPPLSIWYDGTAACGPVNPVRWKNAAAGMAAIRLRLQFRNGRAVCYGL
jgi:hypothetical protein